MNIRKLDILKLLLDPNSDPISSSDLKVIQEKDISYNLRNRLGGGQFSDVYSIKLSEKDAALKVYKLVPDKVSQDKFNKAQKEFKKEAMILQLISHPNIIQSFGALIDDNKFIMGLICEKCICSLFDLLHNQVFKQTHRATLYPNWNVEEKVNILLQISSAMEYLHNVGVIHRDIKPGNILIVQSNNSNPIVKLADFGLTKVLQDDILGSLGGPSTIELKGTPYYLAPEIIIANTEDIVYKYETDVYAFGVTMNELLTEKIPFENENPNLIMDYIRESKEKRPSLWIGDSNYTIVSHLLLSVVLACWHGDSSQRLAIQKVSFLLSCANITLKESVDMNIESTTSSPPDAPVLGKRIVTMNSNISTQDSISNTSNNDINLVTNLTIIENENQWADMRKEWIEAFESFSLDKMKELIEIKGFRDIYVENNTSNNALFVACNFGKIEIVRYLIENTIIPFKNIHNTNKEGNNALILGCTKGHLNIMKYLIENNVCSFKKLDAKNNNGENVFMYACCYNQLDIVRYLIEECHFTDIYAKNNGGWNALMIACSKGYLEIIKYLIENKTCPFDNLNLRDNNGNTALFYACSEGYLHIVKYFLEQSNLENLKLINNNGENVFMYACCYNQLDIVRYLIEECHFTDIYAKNNIRYNALFLACYKGNLDIIRYLLENNTFRFTKIYDIEENEGWNVLMVACSNGYLEIVKYLIENEICPFREIYAVNSYQWNVLMLTCQKGDLDIVKYLIENNICPFREIYSTNYVGANALMVACMQGYLPIVQYLIENNTCRYTQEGVNALMMACMQGHVEIVQYLIENKICPFQDIFEKNNAGQTIFDITHNETIKIYLESIFG